MNDQKVAIVYDTSEGHTRMIAERLAHRLQERGLGAEVFDAEKAPAALDAYDGVIAGGPLHAGHHGKHLKQFVTHQKPALEQKPAAFFSVSLSAAGNEQQQGDARREMVKFEEEVGWHPEQDSIFAGALLYTKYNFAKRFIMKRISKAAGGDTDTSRDYDYTDWDAVDRFADEFAERLAA
jgi:menaquinone-dependent protoporphyrinogen oxidase